MKTTDVYLAAALLSLKFNLERVDRSNPRRMVFEFSLPVPVSSGALGDLLVMGLADIETMYANKTLMINAADYAEAIKRMKSLIHSQN